MPDDVDEARIKAILLDFLRDHFDIPTEKITDESVLKDFGLDSIMMLDVLLDIEDQLGVKLTDLSIPPNPRLQDVVALIRRNLATAG